jgi:2-amino-4-hydroxy-6-hydroxymethyldihydropteridine diphosphokinase
MNKCYLSLGSNQKSPERQIRQALKKLKCLPSTFVHQVSRLYWNPAWGSRKQQNFCNVMVEISTLAPPFSLLRYCNRIEQRHGRVRKKKYGPRTLDIDIILYGSRRVQTKKLTIPHPQSAKRNFVLVPLFELDPSISFKVQEPTT